MAKKKKEANLISFKVLLTANNDIVTELSMLPMEEVDNVFKTSIKNETVKTILQAGQKKFASLHSYFKSELNFNK